MTNPNGKTFVCFFFFLSLALILPTLHAKIAKFDDFLKERADEAKKAAESAYNPHPEEIANSFNKQVGELLTNGTRRQLGEDDEGEESGGSRECQATNPIDRCWRCRKDWNKNRKKLAGCAKGFGRKTTGGKEGEYYVVTEDTDSDVENPKPGTLRHAVIQEVPLWIIFAKSMVIKLEQELLITSNKTIDGRGVNVHIAYGAGLTIQFVENVIIHGIRIHHVVTTSGGIVRDSILHLGLRTVSDGDGINIFGSSNVWVDHVSMEACHDGLIDAIQGSTAITISNCKFNNHDHVILLGASDTYEEDKIMQVTVAFNRFGKGLVQRMPRCRFGFFHVVNNDYNRWEMYAIGGSSNPTIISQGNRFKGPDNDYAKEVTKRDYASEDEWKHWQWRSEGDKFTNGAFFRESGDPFSAENSEVKKDLIKAKPGTFAGRLTRYSGALKCKAGKPC